jgi:YVTN family beta-propeller protein
MSSTSLGSGRSHGGRLVRAGVCLIAALGVAALLAASATVAASPIDDGQVPAAVALATPPPGWSPPVEIAVPGMQNPNDLAVDPYLGRLYISSRDNDRLLMLNTTTRLVVGSAPVGDLPWGVAVNLSTQRVYIANFGSDTLTVLNSQTLAQVATINLGAGARPTFVRVLSNQRVVVALYGMSGFAVIDAEHNTLERIVTAPRPGAWGLAVDPARVRVFVSFRDADSVQLFDGANNWATPSGGLVAPCGASGSPYGLSYGPGNRLIAVCASVYGASVDTAVSYEVTDASALIERSRNSLDPGGANGGGGVTLNVNSGNTFVTNSLAGTVSVIGALSNRVVATLTTGGDPFGAVADPVAGLVYVGDRAGNRLLVIRDDYVAGMAGGNGIAVDPANGYLYVTSRDNARMLMVNGTTHQTIATAQLGEYPWGIALNPATGRVYAASYDTGKVYVSATGSPGFFASIQVGWEPTFVAVDPAANLVFVVSHKLGELWVINGATNEVIARPSTGGGTGAWGLAINTKLKRAYVTHRESGDLVTMVGSASWHVNPDLTIRACPASMLPYSVAFNPVNDRLYVACATGVGPGSDVNTVAIYDAKADGMHFRTALPIGHGGANGGGGIAVNTATGNVLITNSVEGTVTIVSPADLVTATLPVGLDPFAATADPDRHRFHVVLRNGNNIITLDDGVPAYSRVLLPLISRP